MARQEIFKHKIFLAHLGLLSPLSVCCASALNQTSLGDKLLHNSLGGNLPS